MANLDGAALAIWSWNPNNLTFRVFCVSKKTPGFSGRFEFCEGVRQYPRGTMGAKKAKVCKVRLLAIPWANFVSLNPLTL